MSAIKVFISSVQKELGLERASVAQLISVDTFLAKHCVPILFDKEPTDGRPDNKGYLKSLKDSHVYVLLVDLEYGGIGNGLSATHEEYRLSQKLHLPTAVFIRGLDGKIDAKREPATKEFIGETKKDGHKYQRFHDREDLKPAVRDALYSILSKEFQLKPTDAEQEESDLQIESASAFETVPVPEVSHLSMDESALGDLVAAVFSSPGRRIWDDAPVEALVSRGLALHREHSRPTIIRAAVLLFHPCPASRFPQCEILADAYDGDRITGKPKGQENINAPILRAVEQALAFIDMHTFHPHRVVGLNNVRLDEYPAKALREVLVNALAHRNYEDQSRKVILRIFSDRIEVASPGYPLQPITLAKLRKGTYRPCSRNPLIAQTLSLFKQMEQRGTGFARIRDAMLDHGLDPPVLATADGYFVVTLYGPNGDYDRIRITGSVAGPVTPAMEAQLSQRQKRMTALLAAGEELTSKRCQREFSVTAPVIARDFRALVDLGIAEVRGAGRSTRYRLRSQES